jgi:glutamate synthase domain-containing protein 2
MLLGADAAVIDWPLLLALECRLQSGCAEGDHVCGIDGVQTDWAAARVVNLVHAWQEQLKTWLAALGLHRIHQLRDARDRLAFGDAASFAGLEDLRVLSEIDLSLDQVLGD